MADPARPGPSRLDPDALLDAIAGVVQRDGRRIATAESVTAGRLAAELARGESASDWLCGGIVAYRNEVKHGVLGVPDGPVVTAESATAMAEGARRLLGADVGVGTTGVGGPDPVEGRPAGTVFISVVGAGDPRTFRHDLDGDPGEIVEAAMRQALAHLADALTTP